MNVSSQSSSSADIEILNLNNAEVVQHSILLLKCRLLQKQQNYNELIIKVQQLQPVGNQLNYLITPISRLGVFKLLLDLSHCFSANNVNVQLKITCNNAACSLVDFTCSKAADLQQTYKVQPLYIVCADHDIADAVQQQHLQQINLHMLLVQSIYADRLRHAGYQRCTFTLNDNCQVFRSKLSKTQLWQLQPEQIWQQVAGELLNSSVWQKQLKFVAFLANTRYDGHLLAEDYSYANIRRHLHGHVALGAGGLALFSVAHFYAWPQHFEQILQSFGNTQAVDCSREADESNFRRTYAGVYASTLGAVCHELGHIFDLGHTAAGVMGTGLDYVNRLFTVDTRTEALPQRLVEQAAAVSCKRFTQLKERNNNTFLNKYRLQQLQDLEEFYFSRNCALLLSRHKWLHVYAQNVQEQQETEIIMLNVTSNKIAVICQLPHKLQLIELRSNDNGFVKWYQEFNAATATHCFALPTDLENLNIKNSHLFVLTTAGLMKRLQLPDADKKLA